MNNKKELTLNDLAALIEIKGTETKKDLAAMETRIGKKIDSSIEELARMTAKGFAGVDKKFDAVDKRFDKVEGGLENLEKDVKLIKLDVEDVKLRLDNVAHRFELQEMERKFEKRFRILEMTAGIKYVG
jgi:predicted nuclease with TOPRIM domain